MAKEAKGAKEAKERSAPSAATLRRQVAKAVRRTQEYFLSTQHADGYWWGELESNSTMEAEYLMLTYLLDSDEGEVSRSRSTTPTGRR